ncbi:hypothetical protein [Tahibacter sp.]|uniref:hypothetical protein n=1 Tax=Tahibacter sp. TaxID=2056211 RepID=UPI0028C40F8D|nr:hypothetical protein [Tahibacter sp.]
MSDDQNPWVDIPIEPPYVLPMDWPYIEVANKLKSDTGQLHRARMPEPRSGPRDAPVVVLQINPSYEKDSRENPLSVADEARLRAALIDEYAPHVGIADKSNKWWNRAVAQPLAHFGESGRDRVARGICSIEFFPYPSLSFACALLRLPSQAYQFRLVRDALARDALIVVTRGWSLWLGAIPELHAAEGRTVLRTKNPRSVAISEGNLEEYDYKRILAALQSVPALPPAH